MVQIDEAKIAEIVARVVARVLPDAGSAPAASAREPYCAPAPPRYDPGPPRHETGPQIRIPGTRRGVFDDMDKAVEAAHHAHRALEAGSLDLRAKIVQAMRDAARNEIQRISEMALQETGLGRLDDKLKKNALVVEKTPGLEILRPQAWSGDNGLQQSASARITVVA